MMDQFERLTQSGEWWVDPWWERPERRVYSPHPTQEIAKSAEILRRYFDATWAKELASCPRPNIVFANLCIGGSTMATSLIVELGVMLGQLEHADGIERIVAQLKDERSESAYLELQSAFVFAKRGYEVRFPREGGTKSPDVVVELPHIDLALECKRLQDEAWERWEDDLTSRIITSLPHMKDGRDIVARVELNPRLTQLCMSDEKEGALNRAFLEAIVKEVATSTRQGAAENELPIEFGVHELANVRIAYRDQGEYGSVSGMERASPPLTRRVFQNGIIRACGQIPDDLPGVIVVYSKVTPAPEFFRCFFDAACEAQPERFSKIVAVILHSMLSVAQAAPPLIFLNRHTRFADCVQIVADILEAETSGVVVGGA